MKTKRTLKMTLLVFIMSVMFSFSAFASNGALSLEDLQNQQQETQAVVNDNASQSYNVSSDYSTGKSAIGSISASAKMDTESEIATHVGTTMNSWAAKIMQILGYVISIGLGLITALDVCYIALPPLRGLLANGYVGTADKSSQPGGAGGMGSPMGMGGINSMGMGGYGSRMGGTNFMGSGMGSSMGAQQNNQPASGRTQWVTNAALNAVTSASSGANPFKVYFKQQAVVCVMAPIIYVLAATGVLSKFGFMLGEVVSTWIGGVSF